MIQLFDETYSRYYQILHDLITACIEKTITEQEAREIIEKKAFSNETSGIILECIKEGEWSIFEYDKNTKEISTCLLNKPARMPLSNIERSWIKAVSSDPKFQLFKVDVDSLFKDMNEKDMNEIKPLFSQEDYRVFDQVEDSDPYDNDDYQKHFTTVCYAIKNKYALSVEYKDQRGYDVKMECWPQNIEYSAKDDKFRLFVIGEKGLTIINMGRIIRCEFCNTAIEKKESERRKKKLKIEIKDDKKALERVNTHFSQYGKVMIKRTSEDTYEIEYEYDEDVEKEIAMKVISFGKYIKVIEPESVIKKIKKRIAKQNEDGKREVFC